MSARVVRSAGLAAVLALGACNAPPAAAPDAAAPAPSAAPARAAPPPAPTASAVETSPATDASAADYVLPGDFAPDVGLERLRARFGAANVRIDENLPGAEGETFRGVTLFADDPSRRARLYFQDQQNLRGLSLIQIHDAGSRWRLDNGVAVGMRLSELVRLNGRPIRFSGLDWDLGGAVLDWNGGALAGREDDPVQRNVRLDYAGPPGREAEVPVGEDAYASDDPAYPGQGELLQVSILAVFLPGQDAP